MGRKYKKRVITRRTLYDFFVDSITNHNSDACLLWPYSCWSSGYGHVSIKNTNKKEGTHRLAWSLTHGLIPKGLNICHTCDVKRCYNPKHLFLGTPQENMDDKKNKGRLLFGEKHQNSILTNDIVLEIRNRAKNGQGNVEIANVLGLKPKHVWKITTGRLWPHLMEAS